MQRDTNACTLLHFNVAAAVLIANLTHARYHVNHKPGTAEAFPKAPSSAASLVYDPSRDSWARVEPLPYRR